MGITAESKASDICAAFFQAMDLDGSGFIEEAEVTTIATVGFGQDAAGAAERWATMLKDMDGNADKKISEAEYTAWWTKSTAEKTQEDGTFIKGYADYLLECYKKLSSARSASDLCNAFFAAMDVSKTGFIEEADAKKVSMAAWGADEAGAAEQWAKMLKDMDKNDDKKISKQEYTDFWMAQTKEKVTPEGGFVAGYMEYLEEKLAKVKAMK